MLLFFEEMEANIMNKIRAVNVKQQSDSKSNRHDRDSEYDRRCVLGPPRLVRTISSLDGDFFITFGFES